MTKLSIENYGKYVFVHSFKTILLRCKVAKKVPLQNDVAYEWFRMLRCNLPLMKWAETQYNSALLKHENEISRTSVNKTKL